MGINSIVIKGCLGRDPETREMNGGRQVCSVSMAVSQGKTRPSMWLDLSAFENGDGPNGFAFKNLQEQRKGSWVTATGRLTMRTWEQDGQERRGWGIVVSELDAMPPKQDSRQSGGGHGSKSAPSRDVPYADDEDIRF